MISVLLQACGGGTNAPDDPLPANLKTEMFEYMSFNTSGRIDGDLLSMTAAVGLEVLRSRLPEVTSAQLEAAINAYVFTAGPDNATAIDKAGAAKPLRRVDFCAKRSTHAGRVAKCQHDRD